MMNICLTPLGFCGMDLKVHSSIFTLVEIRQYGRFDERGAVQRCSIVRLQYTSEKPQSWGFRRAEKFRYIYKYYFSYLVMLQNIVKK